MTFLRGTIRMLIQVVYAPSYYTIEALLRFVKRPIKYNGDYLQKTDSHIKCSLRRANTCKLGGMAWETTRIVSCNFARVLGASQNAPLSSRRDSTWTPRLAWRSSPGWRKSRRGSCRWRWRCTGPWWSSRGPSKRARPPFPLADSLFPGRSATNEQNRWVSTSGKAKKFAFYLVVELAVDPLVLVVHELECVRAVAVHVSMTIRYASVAEQEHNLVGRLRAQRYEIPEHIGILIAKIAARNTRSS